MAPSVAVIHLRTQGTTAHVLIGPDAAGVHVAEGHMAPLGVIRVICARTLMRVSRKWNMVADRAML